MSMMRHIYRFFDWWLASLLALIPERIRLKIFQYPDRLLVEFEDGQITISYYNGNSRELIDRKTIKREDELEKAGIIQWLARIKSNYVECIVLVSRKYVLTKSLTLPLSSEKDLREIIGFEMDRQTPFTVDQVYYDTRITSREPEQDKLSLELFVATRNFIDSLLAEIRSWSLPATVISFSEGGEPAAINLLPAEARAVTRGSPDALTLAACAITFILFLTALYLPVLRQDKLKSALENRVEESRNIARQVQPLIEEKKEILERTDFLAKQRRQKIPVVKVLAELTNILPDNTYLERLTIRGNEIQINGESDSATTIIQLLEKSDYFKDAQPRSPVTKNAATNKERFFISATLVAASDRAAR